MTELTLKQFDKLKEDIEECIREYQRLQALYREQTGRDYIPPLRLDDWGKRGRL